MKNEALLTENRVRILEKEEARMMKKIKEARRQADKLKACRDEANRRYHEM